MGKLLRQVFAIIFKPRKGRMNRDLEPRYLTNGDFLDSLNTRSTTTFGGSTGDREIVKGNELAFTLPTYTAQDKVYRIYIEYPSGTPRVLELFDGNNVSQGMATWTAATSLANTYTLATAAITAAFNAQWGAITYSSLTTTDDTTIGYFTVSFAGFIAGNYTLVLTGNVDEPLPIVVAEAIDESLAGEMICIGSYDLQGDLYVWSTNQTHLPSSIDIVSISNDSGKISVEVADTSIFTNFSWIVISGVAINTAANGGWIINITDSTHFFLVGSTFANTATAGGIATINSLGMGEVGLATRDENTQVWTYTTLIHSRVFNFRTKKQPKIYCEKSATVKSLYWTDDYNVPRVLYDRTVSYQNDCLLSFIDPLNTYAYDTLGIESRLILPNSDILFYFISQSQGGGAVPSGNSRYTVRLVTESNTSTDWLPISNPIPATVYSENGVGYDFFGSASGTPTGKINNFQVTGNILGIFKYIELATINYLDAGFNGVIIRRDLIPSNSFPIQHTGQETNTQDLDLGTLNAFTQVYTKIKNIDSLSGRLVISNLETSEEIDLSDFFSTIDYTLFKKEIPETVGSVLNGSIDIGEYQIASNVYEFAGYMMNERYRFGFMVEWLSGGFSRIFYGADIVFDLNAAPHKSFDASFSDYNICRADGGTSPFVAYAKAPAVRFSINANGLVGNGRLKDFVKRVYVMRCPVNNPQVLSCGFGVPAINGQAGGTTSGGFVMLTGWAPNPTTSNSNNKLGEFPFVAGITNDISLAGDFELPTDYGYGDGTASANYVKQPNYGSFYWTDVFMGNTSIVPIIGTDKIINFGQVTREFNKFPGATGIYDYLYEAYDGLINTFDTLDITESIQLGRGEVGTLNTLVYSKRLVKEYYGSGGLIPFEAAEGMACYFSGATFDPVTGNNDQHPLYYAQYYRPIADADDQYGHPVQSTYMWTGAIFECDRSASSVDVYGGDTVAQKTWFKNRYPVTGSGLDSVGQGIGFYCQNRVNFEMRQPSSIGTAFPSAPFNTMVRRWLDDTNTQILVYNRGYNISTTSLNTLQLYSAFNPDPDVSNNNYPVRIAYSENKVPESAQDSYRVFLPFNFKDLDYKDGEIFHHAIFNGELVTWQVLKLMRQYFNPTGMLNTTGGSEIILGDGAVLQRRGQTITTYGTKNGFSVQKGKSGGGNDTFYWIDTTNRAAFRLAYDGTVNLGVIHGMDSFLSNNLRFVDGVDTPADGSGICSTWNERNKEWIITVRGYKTGLDGWTLEVQQTRNYLVTFDEASADFQSEPVTGDMGGIGQVFFFGEGFLALVALSEDMSFVEFQVGEVITGTYSGATATITGIFNYYQADEVVSLGVTDFYLFPQFYQNTVDYNIASPESDDSGWTAISLSDIDYYNIYTLCFNEINNGFDTFYSFLPKIYLQFKNTYLSPAPENNEGVRKTMIFEHGIGEYASWYGDKIAVDGYYTFPINAMSDDIKTAFAMRFRTETTPSRVDLVSSGGQETFMTNADFIFREGNYDSSVRNDTLTSTTGLANDDDTSKPYGDWISVKLTFVKNVYQKMYEAMLKITIRSRNNQS